MKKKPLKSRGVIYITEHQCVSHSESSIESLFLKGMIEKRNLSSTRIKRERKNSVPAWTVWAAPQGLIPFL
jgi:hypothetical protein